MRYRTPKFPLYRVGLVLFALVFWYLERGNVEREPFSDESTRKDSGESRPQPGQGVIEQAYRNRQSDLQVQGEGRVKSLLPDDLDGSRHQRFILQLDSGHTLLIAHNIDLAPKISGLSAGDRVSFFGEYEWNQQGGVVHWTHRDPGGRHEHGWLKHHGRSYQ